MVDRFYIKTDGPLPWGCDYITAGKVYELLGTIDRRHRGSDFVDDKGDRQYAHIPISAHLGDKPWILCDQHGNPVPAPWEGEQKCDCHLFETQCCDICQGVDGTEVDAAPINWQAHAEALAEAAKQAYLLLLKIRSEDRYTLDYQYTLCVLRDQIAEYEGRSAEDAQNDYENQALAAFDQDRGK